MAPKKKTAVKTRKKKGVRREQTEGLEQGLGNHVKMVIDPCAAPLTQSVYAGQRGIVQRFSSTWQFGTGTGNTVVHALSPGGFRELFSVPATSSTSFTPAYVQNAGSFPGSTFLSSNSSGARCISSCMRVNWSGTELNRAGSLAIGVISGSSIFNGVATTGDQIYNLLQKKMRVPDGVVEIRWNPSEADEAYQEPQITAPAENFNDKHMMCLCYIGQPGATFSITTTTVYEWLPLTNTGQPAPPTTVPTVPSAVPKINNILHRMHSGASTFNTMATDAATAMSSMYAAGASGYKLLTGTRAMMLAASAAL